MALALTVAMPVYNEQQTVRLAVADVQQAILDHVRGAELVVVNDGSTDDSPRVLDEIVAADPRVIVIHQENTGHGGALMRALTSARGEYVLLLDSDRQISLDSLAAAWAEIQNGRDCVFGVRRRRHDPAVRLRLMRLVRTAIGVLFGVHLFDANVPFKLLRRSIWQEARQCIPDGTLAPSLFTKNLNLNCSIRIAKSALRLPGARLDRQRHRGGQAVPAADRFAKPLPSGGREPVVLAAAIVVGDAPREGQQAPMLQAMQRGIERPLLDGQRAGRDLFDAQQNPVAVLRVQ